MRLPGSAAKDLAEDRAVLLGPWVPERRAAAARLPSKSSVGLPLLSLGEGIEDRSGTGSPP